MRHKQSQVQTPPSKKALDHVSMVTTIIQTPPSKTDKDDETHLYLADTEIVNMPPRGAKIHSVAIQVLSLCGIYSQEIREHVITADLLHTCDTLLLLHVYPGPTEQLYDHPQSSHNQQLAYKNLGC